MQDVSLLSSHLPGVAKHTKIVTKVRTTSTFLQGGILSGISRFFFGSIVTIETETTEETCLEEEECYNFGYELESKELLDEFFLLCDEGPKN